MESSALRFTNFVHLAKSALFTQLLWFTGYASLSSSVAAKPCLEKFDGLEIDWGAMKVRFSGLAHGQDAHNDPNQTERLAWTDALSHASEQIGRFYLKHYERLGLASAAQFAGEAGPRVTSATYSVLTEYYPDASVAVTLESALPRALSTPGLILAPPRKLSRSDDDSPSAFGGILIRCDRHIRPRAIFRIIDESGKLLFDPSFVAADAFEKNLMARWFEAPTRSEINAVIGPKSVSVAAQCREGQPLRVASLAWNTALAESWYLLAHARIVIALPET